VSQRQETDGTVIPDDIGLAGMIGKAKPDFVGKRSLARPDMLLGAASDEASALRSQMVERLSILSDPSVPLAGNEQMLASIQKTSDIAQKLIGSTASAIVSTVDAQATHQRSSAIRDAVIVIAVFLLALAIVWWVARALTRPLRTLRDGALRLAQHAKGKGIVTRFGAEPVLVQEHADRMVEARSRILPLCHACSACSGHSTPDSSIPRHSARGRPPPPAGRLARNG